MSDHDLYFKDFEEAGEEVVRRNLQLEKYQPQKAKIAQLFLDRLREARRAAAEADQTEIARSAKDAAWASAEAAVKSADRATWANWLSGAALAVSLAALAVSIFVPS
jgi:hypothetical protein